MSAVINDGEQMDNRGKNGKPGSTGFQPVPDGQLIKKRRLLPHWQMGGSAYFITFRTKSINLSPGARKIVLEACVYLDDRKYHLWTAVAMPDHVHLLITPKKKADGQYFSLTEIVHSLKSFTGNRINNLLDRQGAAWQEDYFNRIVRDEAEFLEKWNYTRNNPVKKELCQRPEEWDAFYEYQGPRVW